MCAYLRRPGQLDQLSKGFCGYRERLSKVNGSDHSIRLFPSAVCPDSPHFHAGAPLGSVPPGFPFSGISSMAPSARVHSLAGCRGISARSFSSSWLPRRRSLLEEKRYEQRSHMTQRSLGASAQTAEAGARPGPGSIHNRQIPGAARVQGAA